MGAAGFISALRSLSLPNTFNPYADCCPIHDKKDAAVKRIRALSHMFDAASACEIDSLWIGRDLGYRGGRRTGLALTDDVHIEAHANRWGFALERPTIGNPLAERTAAVIWTALSRIGSPIFLWNVFPLHPHEPGEPFTNRSHNARERSIGEEILSEVLSLLRPKRLVGIGNDATKSLLRTASGRQVMQVRHPSYGGQNDFLKQVSVLYTETISL